MIDTRTPKKRSQIMASVRSKDTGPELVVRKLLTQEGYRYRLHKKGLPGRPDIVFPGKKKIIFVHGCFWHGHRCSKGALPKSRLDYWKPKIEKNKERDLKNRKALVKDGWKVLTIWQCQLKNIENIRKKLNKFLNS